MEIILQSFCSHHLRPFYTRWSPLLLRLKQSAGRWALASSLWVFISVGVSAQTPAPITNLLTVAVAPTNGTIMVNLTTNPVFVTISNYTNFTNITVVGSFGGLTNLQFLDQGRPPDRVADDGIFSTNLIPPKVAQATEMPLELIITGEDLNPSDPTNAIVTLTNIVSYWIVPRPDNDNFTNAIKMDALGEVVVATNNYASLEANEPVHAQIRSVAASVWWKWAPAVGTNVLIDLAGSSFDPVLGVYTGSSLTDLVPIASSTNDVLHGLQANASFLAKAGSTYFIAVSGYDSKGVGDIRLRTALGAIPDTIGPIASITSPAGESLFTTNLVSFSGTAKERNPNDSGVSKVLLQINNLTNIVTAGGTVNWNGVLDLPPGTNLIRAIAVDYAGNRGPAAAIVVRYINPINDSFANAIELTAFAGVETAINGRATKEFGEPLHAANEGGHSIWYAWRAPTTGDLSLNTENSTFDTVLALYIGSSVTNLVEIASNDDAFAGSGFSSLTHKVVGDQTYYIAVDGFGGASGNINLSYSFITTEQLFSLFVSTPLGGTVSPSSDFFRDGARVFLTATPDKNFEFVRWEDQSGTFVSTDNPLALVMNQNYSFEAKFRVKIFSDTFKSGDLKGLPWSTSGQTHWSVQSSGGQFVAKAGSIVDGQSCSLILITNTFTGFGSFDLRVSSEEGWDWLEFYLNGARLNRWSGEVDWQTFIFPVAQQLNTFEWRYVKDANFSRGLDTAFIDNVYIPLERPNVAGTNVVLSLVRSSTGDMRLFLQGQPDVAYVIQASANLDEWVSLSTNTPAGVTLQYIDPDSARFPKRFYRAFSR